MERILKSKYKILEKISESESHVTYKGVYVDSDKSLLIKIYKRELLNSVPIKKLKKDIQILTKIDHPQIPRLIDGDYGWQGFYFIREYIDGQSLGEMKKPLDPETASKIMIRACEILNQVHILEIVCGAFTANNIFTSKGGKVSVSDIGINTSVFGEIDQKAKLLFDTGSKYLAPEVILGEEPTVLSDIYQAGVTLYFILTGEFPQRSLEGLSSSLENIKGSFSPPSAINNKIPKYLDEIVMHCLERDPLLRFESAMQLASSLENKALMINKMEEFELSEINFQSEEEPAQKPGDTIEEEIIKLPGNIKKGSGGKINILRWVMFAVWAAIAAGIIYSLINIFVMGE